MIPSPVTLFGGTGFLGRYVVKHLVAAGARVRVACRNPERGLFLKPLGDTGQVVLAQANLRDQTSVAAALADAQAVINLVGILFERGRQTFAAIHAQGAERVAQAARAAGIERLVHVSAIGASPRAPALYARSKAAGEAAVRNACPGASIVRPSLLFGPEDDFFNKFAAIARLSPALPLIGGGRTRFQPVYVGDVARAVVRIVGERDGAGQTYELGGPRIYSFRELMELMLDQIGRKRLLVPVPSALAAMQAFFLEWLPTPPLTRDQLRLLEIDNVVGEGAKTLADLAITPTPVETILPTYLARFRPGGGRRRDLPRPG